jgi:hypothetical protein
MPFGMLMKSQMLIGGYLAAVLAVPTAAGSWRSAILAFENAPVTEIVDGRTSSFDCRKANEYRFVVVENPNRKKDSDMVMPEDLNIVVGDDIIANVELPKESEVKNFRLIRSKTTRVGFVINVDWGGGLYHYEVKFNFKCRENEFYLYRVTKLSFSTTNPDSGKFWDRKRSKVTRVEPSLAIEKFVMTDYL